MTPPLRPLTESILHALPGSRAPWIAAWAAVPWANAGVNATFARGRRTAVWEGDDVLVVLNYASLSLAVALALWGVRRLARRIEDVGPAVRAHFDGLSSVRGPLAAALASAVAFGAIALVADGVAAGVLRAATWFVLGVALWTFLWAYGCVQRGLDRVGAEQDGRSGSRADPAAGVLALGGLAFTGLWILLAALVPVLLTGFADAIAIALGASVFLAALAMFVRTLVRLHRRLVEFKRGELALARELYALAYEPVRAEPTLDVLERQRGLLAAADALEKRAKELREWPIDQGTLAWVITIATSVIAMSLGRMILDPLGL